MRSPSNPGPSGSTPRNSPCNLRATLPEVQRHQSGNYLPEAQACLREQQPPLLAIRGANDPYYPKAGAEAFRQDVPAVEIHSYDAGHFAIETHLYEIASHMKQFLLRNT